MGEMTDVGRCPDDGACHHSCGAGACFRVLSCGPLSAAGFPRDEWPPVVVGNHETAKRMRDFADELDGPLACTQPAYGAPGHPHCAACCYGTGRVITSSGDQAHADAADALRLAASALLDEASSQVLLTMERAPYRDETGALLRGLCGHCQIHVDSTDPNHRVTAIMQGGRGVECVLRGDIEPRDGGPLAARR